MQGIMPSYIGIIFLLACGFHVIQNVQTEDSLASNVRNRSNSVVGSILGSVRNGIAALESPRKTLHDTVKSALGGNATSSAAEKLTNPEAPSELEKNIKNTLIPPLFSERTQDIGNLTKALLNDTLSPSGKQPTTTINTLLVDTLNLSATAINYPLDLSKEVEDNVAELLKSPKVLDVGNTAMSLVTRITDIIFKLVNGRIKGILEDMLKTLGILHSRIVTIFDPQAERTVNSTIASFLSQQIPKVLELIKNIMVNYVIPMIRAYKRARELFKFLPFL